MISSIAFGAGTVVAAEHEEATFEVEILETNAPITEGDTLEVTARITNTGDAEDAQQIHLKDPDHNIVDSIKQPALTLAPGESQTVTLAWETADGNAVEGDFTVNSNIDSDTIYIEIHEASPEDTTDDSEDTEESNNGNGAPSGTVGDNDDTEENDILSRISAAIGSIGSKGPTAPGWSLDTKVIVEDTSNGGAVILDEVPHYKPVSIPLRNATNGGVAVADVTATFNMGTNIDNEMHVETMDSPPADVPEPETFAALTYVEVEINGNLADRLSEASLTLDLDESELDGVSSDDVMVYLYHDGEWQAVETQTVNERTVTVYSQSFSVFAIGTAQPTESASVSTDVPRTTQAVGPTARLW